MSTSTQTLKPDILKFGFNIWENMFLSDKQTELCISVFTLNQDVESESRPKRYESVYLNKKRVKHAL